ncbi:MAG TPA: response regulator transcription factor [Firmicutes bacterium]|nr:response regulator transcription factor [Bacillota bacterium]
MNILIAEDEERMRRLVKDFLVKEGYNVLEAADGQEAMDILETKMGQLSLVILDVMMPHYDGWSLLRHIRKKDTNLPVIMLTARSEDSDEVFGLELGASDYITKPFSPIVLMARIKLLLRQKPEATTSNVKDFQGLVIDEVARIVTNNGERLDLSPKEYELLVYLAVNRKVALSREQILNALWGYDYFGDLRTVDTHIKKLRAKLGDKGDLIETVRGYGYRFEG